MIGDSSLDGTCARHSASRRLESSRPPVSEALDLDTIVLVDEPFGDASALPTYHVSKLAREHVTVILSGDGGDELFAGYNRYGQGLRVARALRFLPRPAASCLSSMMGALPPSALASIVEKVQELDMDDVRRQVAEQVARQEDKA